MKKTISIILLLLVAPITAIHAIQNTTDRNISVTFKVLTAVPKTPVFRYDKVMRIINGKCILTLNLHKTWSAKIYSLEKLSQPTNLDNISQKDESWMLSSTVAGVAISHSPGGATTASATLAGMDVNVSSAGTWDVSTTLNGVTLTVDSDGGVTAAMGLAGNTVTITNAGPTSVEVSRDLTSGANLTAGYDTSDNSLALVATVSF